MTKGAHSAAKVRRESMAGEAVALRIRGKTYQQIAQTLGVSDGLAFKVINEELERRRSITREQIETIRDIELERLESWLDKLDPNIEVGDTKSIQTAVKIQERKSKLLGLDAAIDIEVKAANISDADLIAKLRDAIGGTSNTGSNTPPPEGG